MFVVAEATPGGILVVVAVVSAIDIATETACLLMLMFRLLALLSVPFEDVDKEKQNDDSLFVVRRNTTAIVERNLLNGTIIISTIIIPQGVYVQVLRK